MFRQLQLSNQVAENSLVGGCSMFHLLVADPGATAAAIAIQFNPVIACLEFQGPRSSF